MDSLLSEITPINPPPPLPSNPIEAETEKNEGIYVDSSDSHIDGLLAELRNSFTHSFEDLISSQPHRERMMAIVTELEAFSQ